MKRIFFLLLILGVLIWLGIELKSHSDFVPNFFPSSVAIMLPHTVIHLESWFAILILVITYITLYYVWRFVKFVINLPRRWREKRAQQRLINSVLSLASGDDTKAQELALDHIKHAANPILHYLIAAFAAQKQQQLEARDSYLQMAYQHSPDAKLPLGLLKAQWQLDAKQYDSALDTLTQLRENAPKQRRVLQLLTETLLSLQRWQDLAELQPLLAKHRIFSMARYLQIMRVVYEHLFIINSNAQRVTSLWETLPKPLHTDLQLIYLYALALQRAKQFSQLEKLLTKTLKTQWNWALVRLYGALNVGDLVTQLQLAQSWLKTHSKDPDLYYTLARLAGRNEQWDECYNYYRQSLALRPDAEVYASYAQALENNGNQQESFVNYRRGLLQYLQQNKLDSSTQVLISE